MNTKNKIAVIFTISVIATSCDINDKVVLKTINKQVAVQHLENRNIDLRQLPFDWDTLYIFNDTYRKSDIEKIIKQSMRYDMSDPGIHLLFLRESGLVYEEHWLETECYDSCFEHINDMFPIIFMDSYICVGRDCADFVLTPDNELYSVCDK